MLAGSPVYPMCKWKGVVNIAFHINVIESEAGSTDMPDVLFVEEETPEKERSVTSGRVIFPL